MHHHHPFHRFFGRHRGQGGGGRGFGRFGGGFMDGGGMGPFNMGRKLAAVDLQLLILELLAEKPRHGYEIIKAFEERSKGFYTPSPGMVYPALTYLDEIGHATVETEGTRKLYHITESGKQHLEENREAIDTMFEQFGRVAERMERVRRAFRNEDVEEGGHGRGHHGSKEFMRARRDLVQAIEGKWDESPEEQRRIIDIVKRAADEIRGK
jgi:DNA-binding PadR family transcriptional regulator